MKAPSWKRARFLFPLIAAYALLCFLQRLIYAVWIRVDTGSLPVGIPLALLKGLAFDLATSAFLFLPLALLLALVSNRWHGRRRAVWSVAFFSLLPLLVGLNSIGFEFFFWEEFQARYNFIAVDYLVYTHEVVRNIWESYPVVWFFLGLFTLMAGIAWLLRSRTRHALESNGGWKERGAIVGIFCALLTLNFSMDEYKWLENDGFWGRELAKNSLFALFSAYNRNEINYSQFYISLDPAEARRLASGWVREESPSRSDELSREIRGESAEKDWNVVLVAIESMSARFMTRFGNDKPITPNLDRMAGEGLFFTKLYATGSRTVRGLEALMLSLPPTPGQSIVRRPNSDNLFNLGTVFRHRGYRTQFLYGGFGRFDNMGPWFESNGFEIIDRTRFAAGGITFSTAWGACDEDLFDEAIRRADAAHAEGKRFFQVALTTSNHRPYDFPDGRIDIPSHTGRDGAVKYTDYAIGRFVEQARKKPWYKNTLFIFVADHNASVAGGTDVPIRDYLIPVIFHNPGLVKAQAVDKLASQIDIAPTLLGMLGFRYKSWFFGQDLLKAKAGRALIGTYQKVALYEPGRLTLLEPGRRAQVQELGPLGEVKRSEMVDTRSGTLPESVKRTAAIYQSASEVFSSGMSKEKAPALGDAR
ncbi:MAG TPA: LTA synthase family protein [Bdellovibrionota bacterium]|jgi:hypothetical protein